MPTVRAKEPFSYDENGCSHNVAAGMLFDADHPRVKKHPHFFERVEVAVARASARVAGTETASAAPGERRARGQAHKPFGAKSGVDSTPKETGS